MKKLLSPKKLADGGEVREGRNENIGDDTRDRALAWLQRGGDSDASPAAKPSTSAQRKPALKPVAKTKPVAQESAAPKPTNRDTSSPAKPAADEGWSGWKRLMAKVGSEETRAKYKAQGYASGGLVQRASVKKHGKAC